MVEGLSTIVWWSCLAQHKHKHETISQNVSIYELFVQVYEVWVLDPTPPYTFSRGSEFSVFVPDFTKLTYVVESETGMDISKTWPVYATTDLQDKAFVDALMWSCINDKFAYFCRFSCEDRLYFQQMSSIEITTVYLRKQKLALHCLSMLVNGERAFVSWNTL